MSSEKELTRREKNKANLLNAVKNVEAKVAKMSTEKPKPKEVVPGPPPAPQGKKKGLWGKIGQGIGKAWSWFKDGGWTEIAAVGAALLDEQSHLRYQLEAGDIIPKGTILYSGYISPETFTSTNLYTKASLFTYYEFVDTFVTVTGLTGAENANGAVGIFINPDPSQDLHTSNPDAILKMVSNFNGAICRLDRVTKIPVPSPEDPLHVNGNEQVDLRLTKQGQLYIVAYTDINMANVSADITLEYKCDFAKDNNPVFKPIQQNILCAECVFLIPKTGHASIGSNAQPNSCTIRSEVGSWLMGSDNTKGVILPAGTHRITCTFETDVSYEAASGAMSYSEFQLAYLTTSYGGTSTGGTTLGPHFTMRNQDYNTTFKVGSPPIFDLLLTLQTASYVLPYLRLTKTGFGGGFLPGLFTQSFIRMEVTPMVIYSVDRGDQVNSALISKTHRVVPYYLDRWNPKPADVMKEDEFRKCATSVKDELEGLDTEAKNRLTKYLRERRMSQASQ